MLDTLAYLPTILAYVFICLLISILTFIVVYICHKLYYIIYDNVATIYVETYKRSMQGVHEPKGELVALNDFDNGNLFQNSIFNSNIRWSPIVSCSNDGDTETIWTSDVVEI